MNLLFVSIAFPPKKNPECIQTARYFKYMSLDQELTIDVLTTTETLNMPIDADMKKYDMGYRNKYEVKLNESRFLNGIISRVYPDLYFPDFKAQFITKARRSKFDQAPDFLYSRSFPISSSMAAFHLKKKFDIPWVMHLSDPWMLSPLNHYGSQAERKHKKWERKCFEEATVVSLTSQKTVELYRKYYPEFFEKFVYFPNVYDESDLIRNDFQFKEKVKIVYTGGMVGTRYPTHFLKAFELLSIEERERFDIVFAGDADLNSRSLLNDAAKKYKGNFTYLGLVDYDKSKELQRSADLLLAIDNPMTQNEYALFFPSKLLDYLIAQRKIIAITNTESSTANILGNNHYVFSHTESGLLANHLQLAIKNHRNSNHDFFINEIVPKEFGAKFQAQKLVEIIKRNAKN